LHNDNLHDFGGACSTHGRHDMRTKFANLKGGDQLEDCIRLT